MALGVVQGVVQGVALGVVLRVVPLSNLISSKRLLFENIVYTSGLFQSLSLSAFVCSVF